MANKNYFQLGTISRLFSFRGQVILYIDADDPSIYYKLDHILIEINGQNIPYFIEKSSIHKPNQLKIKLEGINSEAEAKMIVKKKVFLSSELLPKLNDDQFYYHEIKNFLVINAENKSIIGTIINVIDHPGNTLLEVDVKGIEVLIPLNETTFDHIDKSNKQISIHLPEGLLDLYMEDEQEL
jgi:16S rRNA processing protein RimM